MNKGISEWRQFLAIATEFTLFPCLCSVQLGPSWGFNFLLCLRCGILGDCQVVLLWGWVENLAVSWCWVISYTIYTVLQILYLFCMTGVFYAGYYWVICWYEWGVQDWALVLTIYIYGLVSCFGGIFVSKLLSLSPGLGPWHCTQCWHCTRRQ